MPYLPNTRPSSDNFGEDLENDKPVADPGRELDATNWNGVKGEVAQIASTVPLAIVGIYNNGSSATVTIAMGMSADDISATLVSPGVVEVVFTGLAIQAALVTMIGTGTTFGITYTAGENKVTVNAAANASFILAVF